MCVEKYLKEIEYPMKAWDQRSRPAIRKIIFPAFLYTSAIVSIPLRIYILVSIILVSIQCTHLIFVYKNIIHVCYHKIVIFILGKNNILKNIFYIVIFFDKSMSNIPWTKPKQNTKTWIQTIEQQIQHVYGYIFLLSSQYKFLSSSYSSVVKL